MEAAERASTGINIVTDSKYAMDRSKDVRAGDEIPEGIHKELWVRFKENNHTVLSFIKMKSHMTWDKLEVSACPTTDVQGN